MRRDNHVRDEDLILAAGGELPFDRLSTVTAHLDCCPACRARQTALSSALDEVLVAHHEAFDEMLPSPSLPLAQLESALAHHETRPDTGRFNWTPALATAAAVVMMAGAVYAWRNTHHSAEAVAPNRTTTPGVAVTMGREGVCSANADVQRPQIQASVALAVFRKYGIDNPAPGTYEVDYLIPPALGGSDDPRNLWPQPYSTGIWNARVKDALEDRLHSLVCSGRLDLATAQRDLSRDWIAAYKKYFRTDRPLVDHAAFVKDRPWQ